MSGLAELARFQSRLEAGFAEQLLVSRGVHVMLFDVGMSDMGLGPVMPIRLMVPREDAEAAARILVDEGVL